MDSMTASSSSTVDKQLIDYNNGTCATDANAQENTGKGSIGKEPNAQEWCRDVGEVFTPYMEQVFGTIDEAVEFYKIYALACGFDVRKYTTKRWHGGEIKSKLLVCNRQGYTNSVKAVNNTPAAVKVVNGVDGEVVVVDAIKKKTKVRCCGCKARIRLFNKGGILKIDRFHIGHNHELISPKDREFQKLSRNLTKYHKQMILNNSRLKIGATRTYNLCKEQVEGFANVGASLVDFKNWGRNIKCFLHERDGQLFIDRFKDMAKNRKGFYFDYDLDEDGSVSKVFWADGEARRNYQLFGDAVSFDPTYGTNKYRMIFTPFIGVDHHKRSVTFAGALIAHEDNESFVWVFERFLTAMGGKEPEYIITDQDPGIIPAVKKMFKTALHRFCMWHILNKVPAKYGAARSDYQDFLKRLNAIVWDVEIDGDEFDAEWCAIMEEFHGGDDEWFSTTYSIRGQWVMAHCRDLKMGGLMRTTQRSESENSFFKRFEQKSGTLVEFWMRFESAMDQQQYTQKKLDNDNAQASPKTATHLPIEHHASKIYTHAPFEEFQKEVKFSVGTCSVRGFLEKDGVEETLVRDATRDKEFTVKYISGTSESSCTCRLFNLRGILCRHVIWIYSSKGLNTIPENMVTKRWTKEAVRIARISDEGLDGENTDIIDRKRIEMSRLWSEIHETMGLLRAGDKTDLESLCGLIREFRLQRQPVTGGGNIGKTQELENMLGCTTSENITILPPKFSKTKASGKRMLSSKEKKVALSRKPKRMCNNCKQMAHHDKRNCPNPYAERPPKQPTKQTDDADDEDEVDEDIDGEETEEDTDDEEVL